jgi:two-component system, sensor histidine kinase
MQALQLYLEVIVGLLPDPDHPAMVRAKQCVDGLSNQLSALLDLSKLDAGKLQVAPTRFKLDELIEQIVSAMRPLCARKGLKIRAVRSPRLVFTDRNLFERLLTNLASNAVRYTEKGGVLIGCRRHDGKDWVEVWDSGVGIPPDSLSAIFEEFFQLNNPGRNSEGGTGLGLAIVNHIAMALELKVAVHSTVGKGSVFAVELPTGPSARSGDCWRNPLPGAAIALP